jgi:hypothetical protein
MYRLHPTQGPEKYGRYTFEVEPSGNVKITNKDGTRFYVMSEALLRFLANQIRRELVAQTDEQILERIAR